MMITDQIDRIAKRYALGYGQFLKALIGVTTNAMTSPNALEPKVASGLSVDSLGVAGAFLETHQIVDDGTTIMLDTLRYAGDISDEDLQTITGHCMVGLYVAQAAIGDAVTKDKVDARTVFRRFVFDATLRAATHSTVGALIAARAKHLPIRPLFLKPDRIGRGWTAEIHMQTLVRAALLNTYVDSYLFAMMARGIYKARVVYRDADHEDNGLVFSIDGSDQSIPAFEDIRAQIFHPNSTARLEPVTE